MAGIIVRRPGPAQPPRGVGRPRIASNAMGFSTMRIACLNTWKNTPPYDDRLAAAAATLRAAGPDLVLLQEVFVGAGRDTGRELADALGLALCAAPARLKRRPHGDAMVESSNGLAILARRPPEEATTVDLPSDPADPGRIAQIVWFGLLTVANTHLTHLKGRADLRRAQARALLAALPKSGPVLIGGDLNSTPGSLAMRALARDGFADLASSSPFPTCAGRRIDFLLARGIDLAEDSVRPLGGKPDPRTGVRASDHVGLVGVLPVPAA